MSLPADVTARIARLFVYPVKSCAGVELREAVLTETGLDLDRAWMVVDTEGNFVTQRELPRMALIRPQLKVNEVVGGAVTFGMNAIVVEGVDRTLRVGQAVSANWKFD